jgi:hypothetical protein
MREGRPTGPSQSRGISRRETDGSSPRITSRVLRAFGHVADILQAFTHDARSSWTLSDEHWIQHVNPCACNASTIALRSFKTVLYFTKVAGIARKIMRSDRMVTQTRQIPPKIVARESYGGIWVTL